MGAGLFIRGGAEDDIAARVLSATTGHGNGQGAGLLGASQEILRKPLRATVADDDDLVFSFDRAAQSVVMRLDHRWANPAAGELGRPVARNLARVQRCADACEDDRAVGVELGRVGRLQNLAHRFGLGANLIVEGEVVHGTPRIFVQEEAGLAITRATSHRGEPANSVPP